MLNTQFSPWPCYTDQEAEAAKQVLLSNRVNYWTGSTCRTFESEYAEWVGTEYAIAVANGTLALDLALRALGVCEGDEVIVPARTFVATALAVLACGATPIFADVELDNQNISAHQIKKVLSPKTKAVIVVHLAGMPADMDSIMALAKEHDFYVVEDCAQAHGAKYKGRSVGSIGHIGAWSFCQDKIMTTGGEGGMVTTNHRHLWQAMWSYKDHGKNFDTVYQKSHPPGFRWLHESLGSNYRMTEMQAAIGLIQLQSIEKWSHQRRLNANAINQIAAQFQGVRSLQGPSYIDYGAYKHYLFLDSQSLTPTWSRDKVIQAISDLGVPCYSGSCSEIYLEQVFTDRQLQPQSRLTNAQLLGESSLMFLVHPTLTAEEITKTCQVLEQVLSKALV